MIPEEKTYEFSGWLKFMLVMIGAGMIMTVINDFSELAELGGDDVTTKFAVLHSLSFVGLGCYAIFSFLTRRPNAVFWGYAYLTACLISNTFSIVGNLGESDIIVQGIRALVTCVAWFVFLYFSENVRDIFPPEKRKAGKKEWTVSVISIALPYVYLLVYILLSIGKGYDPEYMYGQYTAEDGYYTDGIVAFKIPSDYFIEDMDADGTKVFTVTDALYEPEESITIVSEFNYELTDETFEEYYEAWMAEDFAYLSTTVVKDEEDSVEGKHYRYRRVYIEEYDVYWEFAIVNEPEITKNCLISIYTAEPEDRLFFFIRSLKFI